MKKELAKVLLESLSKRFSPEPDGKYSLDGKLTELEFEALQTAITLLDEGDAGYRPDPAIKPIPKFPPDEDDSNSDTPPQPPVIKKSKPKTPEPELETRVLKMPPPPDNVRLCLDFGTAMSKATLVCDGESEYDDEKITVLKLGAYGDTINDFKLISAVYIDPDSKLWFGSDAIENSDRDSADGEYRYMDNIKHWLSLNQVDEEVDREYNPTGITVRYCDVILAYLTFLTWSANKACEALEQPDGGYKRNLNRRFAMPCLSGPDAKEMHYTLQKYLGEAQILADTFFDEMREGIPLDRFLTAVRDLRELGEQEYEFVREGLSEPLGVASSMQDYFADGPVNKMVMVIDIGAGTTDFSLYQMRFDPEHDKSIALEAKGSAAAITNAGNYLDAALEGFLRTKLNYAENEVPQNVTWYIHRHIRDFKEILFKNKKVDVYPPDSQEITVSLDEFCATESVKSFTGAIRDKMKNILETINKDWTNVIGPSDKFPYLTVVLTGGGSTLPMVKQLANDTLIVRAKPIPLKQDPEFPAWLREKNAELEDDYPRIAVSLGGARKKLIQSAGSATVLGGSVRGTPIYDDPKYQW